MKTNITLSIDTRRKRKDGMCPIIFRLSHHQKTIAIATGSGVPPEYWNQKSREVKKTYKDVSSVARLNNLLVKKKIELRYGISFVDMAFLKVGDIIDGRIQYRRQKTARYNPSVIIDSYSLFD